MLLGGKINLAQKEKRRKLYVGDRIFQKYGKI